MFERIENMKVLVTGVSGQLGHDVMNELAKRGHEGIGSGMEEVYAGIQDGTSVETMPYVQLDITDENAVSKMIHEIKPDVVIHCAAWTAVDMAEDDNLVEKVRLVNAKGTQYIASACKDIDCKMVYISTDYVFDGKKPVGQEWEVDDQPDPQTEYGRTKRMGEELVEKHVSNFYIIRTAWVFGNYGKNFVFTMQNLAKTHKTLTVVNDQHGRPTWTRTLAEFMTYLAENRKEYGYYHLSNDAKEDTTWYDFAVEILKDTDVEVKPVDSSQFPAKAKRPLNSTMSLAKAKATGFVIPTWQDALKEFYKQEVK